MSRSGADFQAVAIPDGAFAAVLSHLEILSQFQAIGGASIFAEAAKHAARSVVGKGGENFAASGVVAQPANNNQIFGAREGAKIAGDAQRLTGFGIHVQARRAAVTLGNHGAFLRILLGVNVFGILVAESDPHALEQVDQEYFFQEFVHRKDSVPSWWKDVKEGEMGSFNF